MSWVRAELARLWSKARGIREWVKMRKADEIEEKVEETMKARDKSKLWMRMGMRLEMVPETRSKT